MNRCVHFWFFILFCVLFVWTIKRALILQWFLLGMGDEAALHFITSEISSSQRRSFVDQFFITNDFMNYTLAAVYSVDCKVNKNKMRKWWETLFNAKQFKFIYRTSLVINLVHLVVTKEIMNVWISKIQFIDPWKPKRKENKMKFLHNKNIYSDVFPFFSSFFSSTVSIQSIIYRLTFSISMSSMRNAKSVWTNGLMWRKTEILFLVFTFLYLSKWKIVSCQSKHRLC